MNKKLIELIARILLGLIFFVFGLNGFFQFIPMPPLPEPAMNFMGALMATGYFLPVLKATEVVAGLMLLSGFYVPLALILLAPIIVQILLFHTFIVPDLAMPIFILILELVLAYIHKGAWTALLTAKSEEN